MIQGITRRRFLVYSALTGAGILSGRRVAFASSENAPRFFFAVLSDPHAARDSWTNALTEVRDLKVNPDPQYGPAKFLLVTGDTNPIDRRYEDYTAVFKGVDAPFILPVIGNHEADDTGGFPGDTTPMNRWIRPGGGQQTAVGAPPSGMGQPPEGQPDESGQPVMGTPPGRQSEQGGPRSGNGKGAVVQMPGQRPGMYPDDGNPAIIDMEFIRDKIIPAAPGVVRMREGSCTYYCDYQNVRIISIDAYSGEAGIAGIIDDTGRAWAEAAITSAPAAIDHVFIAFHDPAFPRVRHTYDSFNADPELRNTFWNMLIAHRDKVRAVFCGHTHSYARMRVLDPAGEAANDFTAYPDEEGGIYQINSGSTGNGMENTFVTVGIDGKKVCFRTFEAENGADKPFSLKEEWCVTGT